ncbi:CG33228, partial [Drosophila busckii]
TNAACYNWRKAASAADVEQNLLQVDNLPESYQLIYRAPLENYLNWTKNVSTATVTTIGLLAGYQYATSIHFINVVQQINVAMLVSNETDLYYFAGGFVLINLAIRAFVAKYPLRIYKSVDNYCAVYSSQLPFGTVKHYFEKGEIAEYKNILNPWSNIMYKLGRRSSMLLVDYFRTPSEFHKLFEQDK